MATVSSLSRAEGGKGNPSPKAYFIEQDIDFAAAATAKGTALAASDVIEALTVGGPAIVLAGGIEVIDAAGGGTGTVLDLGVTGGDVDALVDGFAFDSASAGDYADPAAGTPVVISADDTIDVLIQAATTVSTSGKIRVWAVVVPLDTDGTKSADEVTRDQLA